MFIDGLRPGGPIKRNTANRTSGEKGVFSTDAEPRLERAGTAVPPPPTTGIEALLALQAIEDPMQRKRRAVKRGQQLLDLLDDMKGDLLAGRMSEGRINKLLALLTQARIEVDPDLAGTIADIELRARVELAKAGHFPAF